ncbi:HNH endonuclease signature motif containing protein [Micromonospora endolithica]|uniref:HNH endonuclease n=1 Tax=Micromonospora endolithica TaxID=230091 RepID=A0A3A9ZKT8_9ACTN|nr:HNH endonuclease signature motif containing protein [Micromonospora endolithica]RKN47876.1 HNH endonuclease [Micromonospora endolithica]TWJ21574.1 HNH endonuclease [Micromonospora endolithica]
MVTAIGQLRAAVDDVVDVSPWALSEADLIAALDAVHLLEQRLAAARLGLVREVDSRGLATAQGAASTAGWLRDRLRITGRAARHMVAAAVSLDAGPAPARSALAQGTITVEQALVVVEAVGALPVEAGPEVADKAAQVLVDLAAVHEPIALRRLGARILDHVAPDLAERAEAEALRRAEERALTHRHVTISEQPDGQVRLSGRLDGETAALLRAAIEPLCPPSGTGDDRGPGQRRHDALAEVCRLALRTGDLPEHGGDRPQLVVSVALDPLVNRLGAGTLDTGLRLSPAAVRRIACDAAVLPAVLGGDGQVLDVGRQRRLVTGPLRRALVLRDGGCAFPGCDRPPRWCDGHHIRHWSDGGATRLDNAVLLCGHHHRVVHQGDWTVRLGPDGRPEFRPPAWLDPHRSPRRNLYHRRC